VSLGRLLGRSRVRYQRVTHNNKTASVAQFNHVTGRILACGMNSTGKAQASPKDQISDCLHGDKPFTAQGLLRTGP